MKEIFYNDDNLLREEIDEVVTRVKALIINNKQEILMGYCDGTYQFPGGHLENEESLIQGLKREIREETGITLIDDIEPFLLIKYYTKNYRGKGLNRENKIYYYYIKSELEPVVNNMSLDANERANNYTVKRIALKELVNELDKTIDDNNINEILYKEIKLVLNEI